LVNRSVIASGTTSIHALDGRELDVTLTEPLDAALVDDSRVSRRHGGRDRSVRAGV
jgi:hypothetical protein